MVLGKNDQKPLFFKPLDIYRWNHFLINSDKSWVLPANVMLLGHFQCHPIAQQLFLYAWAAVQKIDSFLNNTLTQEKEHVN